MDAVSTLVRNIAHLHIDKSQVVPLNKLGSNFTLQSNKDGVLCASYNDKTLHSQYDPNIESEKIIKKIVNYTSNFNSNSHEHIAFDAFVIFEMGLGYVPTALYQKFPNIPIIIVQLNNELTSHLLNNFDYTLFSNLQHCKIFCNTSTNSIITYLYSQKIVNPLCIDTQAAKNIYDKSKLNTYIQDIANYQKNIHINLNSIKKYGYRWISNIAHNLNSHHTLVPISDLKNMYEKMPILFCAAGPSLDDHLELLSTMHKKMPVVCVDTALSVCIKKDIIPDFIVTTDPQFINSRHLSNHINFAIQKGSKLVIDILSSSNVLHSIQNHTEVFVCISDMPLNTLLFPELKSQYVSSGGSVATIAYQLCLMLGATAIYTLGLDLSYCNKKFHAKDTYFERISLENSTKLDSSEQHLFQKIQGIINKTMMRTYGSQNTLSDTILYTYMEWFCKETKKEHAPMLYCFSEASGYIEGRTLITQEHVQTHLHAIPENRVYIEKKNKSVKTLNNTIPISAVLTRVDALLHTLKKKKTILTDINISLHTALHTALHKKNGSMKLIDNLILKINEILKSDYFEVVHFFYFMQIPISIFTLFSPLPKKKYHTSEEILTHYKHLHDTLKAIITAITQTIALLEKLASVNKKMVTFQKPLFYN